MSLGETVTIECNEGFRASRNPAAAVNVSSPRTYTSRCTETCAPSSAWSCQPLTCTPPVVKNATVQQPERRQAFTVDHNAPVSYKCNSGYKLEGSSLDGEGPCLATFSAQCRDGVTYFTSAEAAAERPRRRAVDEGQGDGPTYDRLTPPKCVRIIGCSPSGDDVCGSEGCGAVPLSDNGEVNGVPAATSALHEATVEISCNAGYAAVAQAGDATCEAEKVYSATCGTCMYTLPNTRCMPVICQPATDDNGTVTPSEPTFTYGQNATVDCNSGFRAATADATESSYTDPKQYETTCSAECTFMQSAGLKCAQMRCGPPPDVPNAAVVKMDESSEEDKPPMHEGYTLYECADGWEVDVAAAACKPGFKAQCVDGEYTMLDGERSMCVCLMCVCVCVCFVCVYAHSRITNTYTCMHTYTHTCAQEMAMPSPPINPYASQNAALLCWHKNILTQWCLTQT